ncbi:MAG: DUF309 domain-containing protein [Lysinibacillus sp.]
MHPQLHTLFIQYCMYFNGNEDYFECHEVLEEYWKEIAPGDKLHPLVGYIQLATALYHWRRDNFNGAYRILQKAKNNFERNEQSLFFDYIDLQKLYLHVNHTLEAIQEREPFTAFPLDITCEVLQSQTVSAIKNLPYEDPKYLLHKHMLRDRSEILNLREEKRKSRH